MSTETKTTSEVDFNHWLLRFVALLIDGILVGIVAYAIWWVLLWVILFGGLWLWGWGFWVFSPFMFVFGIILTLYSAVLEVSSKATIGKKLLGLEVRTVGGGNLTFDKAFIRNISKIFWVFLLLDWLLILFIPGRDIHQKYTDRIAGTTVVTVRQVLASTAAAPSPPPPPPPSA